MSKKTANERVFQGELWKVVSGIIQEAPELRFSKITQEENIGVNKARFADGLLYSSSDVPIIQ